MAYIDLRKESFWFVRLLDCDEEDDEKNSSEWIKKIRESERKLQKQK